MPHKTRSIQQPKKPWVRVSLFSLLSFAVFFTACKKKPEINLAVCGSSGIVSALEDVAAAYEKTKRVRVIVLRVKSRESLDLLVKGESDIAASLLRMPGELSLKAQKGKRSIAEVIIGYDVIVPVVHTSNPVKNLFLGQLADIYTGLIDDWKDIEMEQGRIIVVDREKTSAIRSVMTKRFFYSDDEKELENVVKSSDEEVADAVAKQPRAIGYISRTALAEGIKIVTINQIEPTDENVLRKYYKLYRELYLYYDESARKEAIHGFIDFVRGKEGQDILHRAGIIPAAMFK